MGVFKAYKSARLLSVCFFVVLQNLVFAQSWSPSVSQPERGNSDILVKEVKGSSDEIVLQYRLPKPTFIARGSMRINDRQAFDCTMGKAHILNQEGLPMVPMVTCRAILPSGTGIKNLEVTFDDQNDWSMPISLTYGNALMTYGSEKIHYAKPDFSVYHSENSYPEQPYQLVDILHRNGVAIALINFYPLTYYPKSGKICYTQTVTVRITTARDKVTRNGVRVDLRRFKQSFLLEDNPSQLDSYADGSILGAYENRLCNPKETFDYLIISNKDIIEAKTKPNINDFVNLKKAQNLQCKVENIQTILSAYSGSDNSEKLRSFIKDSYNTNKIKYVLLGGDINIVPMKTTKVTIFAGGQTITEDIPTDLPYQCFDEAKWAKDYEAEVFVGRVSAENAEEFSNFVYKTIKFQNDPLSMPYKKSSLLVGEMLTEKAHADDFLIGLKTYMKGYTFDQLSDKATPWKVENIINKVNSNAFSLLNHLGHSNTTYNMRLASKTFTTASGTVYEKNWNHETFTNTNMIFLYTQGCVPGAFDSACIGEDFTTTTRTGMFAGVFNSRYGLFSVSPFNNKVSGPSGDLHISFLEKMSTNAKSSLGECNAYSHSKNSSKTSTPLTGAGYKWVIAASNLLGDPSIQLAGKDVTANVSTTTKTILHQQPTIQLHTRSSKKITLTYDLGLSSRASLTLYSPMGKRLIQSSLVNRHGQVFWDLHSNGGHPFAAGTYFIKVKTLNGVVSSSMKKMVIF